MKYKVGDKVRIHSKEWYDKHKDECGNIKGAFFDKERAKFCGTVQTIASTAYVSGSGKIVYAMEDAYEFIGEEAIEGLAVLTDERLMEVARDACSRVDEEMELRSVKSRIGEQWSIDYAEFKCPDDYTFKDENGNVINVTKIVLEKKEKEYPKTYEECCYVLGFENTELVFEDDYRVINPPKEQWKRLGLINQFNKLLICRDAYWKIAGEEMGLGKPWTPQDTNTFSIFYDRLTGEIEKQDGYCGANSTLEFPTPEMRDAFYETFKVLIEECKELL